MNKMLKVTRIEDADKAPTRQSLLGRLKNWNDQESWRVFFDTYWRLIYEAACRAGLNDSEAQDVVQETVIAVCKNMPTFQYDTEKGSFKGWLLRLTGWRIQDQFRKRQRIMRLEDPKCEGFSLEEIIDPAGLKLEDSWDDEWERNLLQAAVERVKIKIDPKKFQIFDLHVVKGMPVLAVARLLKVNAATVYLVKHRVGNILKKEVSRLRVDPLSIPKN